MNGQLSDNPLPELIRELSLKNLSGRLRLELEKVKVVIYFKSGSLTYAGCNVRSLRLGEYLVKKNLITEDELLHLGARTSDFDLVRTLTSEKRLSRTQAAELQARQVSDVLRLALLWTEGTWEFDYRSQLGEDISFKLDVPNLLLEASRRLPLNFTASRFRDPTELFTPAPNPPAQTSLLPAEGFLLYRLAREMRLGDLIAQSGLREFDAMRVIYSLSIAGFLQRSNWRPAFRDLPDQTQTPAPTPAQKDEPIPEPQETVESFLQRLASSESHYDILGVGAQAKMSELKSAYYDIARKYHPDRFRMSPGNLLTRVESAFARITQAYDTLRDPGLRATYDSKLDAKMRASQLAQSAPKAVKPSKDGAQETPIDKIDEPRVTLAQQAETQFKDGFAALELRQRTVAIGLLGSAARSLPDEPRYRAYYGRALALHESTRRLAEVELQAAVRLDPQNVEYRIMLSELYRDLGFIVRAKGEAERAVAADRNNPKARDLLRSLTSRQA